jgi:hypothetical protein
MSHDGDLGEDDYNGQSAEGEQAEKGNVAEVRDTVLQWLCVMREELPGIWLWLRD